MGEKFHTTRGYELQSYNKKLLTSSMEDYLEMIYRLGLTTGYVRLNELAQLLNVRNSSATKMVKKLCELELVNHEKYGLITLTEEGKVLGKFLLDRHNIIEEFFTFLGCKKNVLIETELIEHVLSNETVQNIKIFNKFIKDNTEIIKEYINYREKELNSNE